MNRSAAIVALLLILLAQTVPPAPRAQEREDEIVANLATGRLIVHVTKEGIVFATIEETAEASSIAPRVISLDASHIGVLLGAAEWVLPGAGGNPIRLEKSIPRLGRGPDAASPRQTEDNRDLEMIGVAFLEALRPLASQLHHKIELGPDEPLFELIAIGYAPDFYGPEVWLYEYRVTQEALRGDYLRTSVLRPRTMQLYPPRKHEPRTLVEVRYPPDTKGPSLQERILQNDPLIARVASSDPKFAGVVQKVQEGKAQNANSADAAEFLRAVVVPLAGKARFAVGTYEESHGLAWLVPPEEPIEKAKEDKNRSPDAPTLRRKP